MIAVSRNRATRAILALLLGAQALFEVLHLRTVNRVGADFLNQIYAAGGDVLDGRASWLTHAQDSSFTTAPYPPPVVMLLSPFSALHQSLATVLWLLVLAAATALVLPILEVYDWRCQVLWLLSAPVVIGLYYGNITLLLVLALALMWRYRDRPVLCSSAAVFMAVVKLWPVIFAVWMWSTGRRRAAIYTAVATPVLVLSTWAALGFAGLRQYPVRLDTFSKRFVQFGYSLVTVQAHAGLSIDVATAAAAAIALVLIALALGCDERTSLLLFVAAGLASSPIVWLHYLGFLIVPICVLAPRLGPLWLYVPALWVAADLFTAYDQPSGAVAVVVLTSAFVALAVRLPGLLGLSALGPVLSAGSGSNAGAGTSGV